MKIFTASLATVIFLPLKHYATAFIAPSRKQSAFFRRPLGTSTSSQVHEAPTPLYEIDFSDPDTGSNLPEPFTLHGGAEIKPAPGGSNALRIDRSLAYVELPGVDISPAKMRDCTLVISVYLESIVGESNGWILTSDNGVFDRSIILHDDRFKGLGLAVGYKDDVCFYDDEKLPEVGKWIQFSAVFRQGGACNLYYNDEKAPKSYVGKNQHEDALKCLRIGTEKVATEEWKDHFCDAWVGDVKVFDRALGDDEIEELNKEFQDKVNGVDDSEDSEGGSGSDSGSNQNSLPPVYAEGMLQNGMLITLESVLYPGAFWKFDGLKSSASHDYSRLKPLDPYFNSGYPDEFNELKVWKYYDREQDPIEEFVALQAMWELQYIDNGGSDTFLQLHSSGNHACTGMGVNERTLKDDDGDYLYEVPKHTWQFHTVHDDIVEIVFCAYRESPPTEERKYMYVEPTSKGESVYEAKNQELNVRCGVPTHEDEEIATKGKQWRVHFVQQPPSLPDGTIVALESMEFPGMYIEAGEELSKKYGHNSWCSLSDKHYNEGDNLRKWRVLNKKTKKDTYLVVQDAVMFECVDRPGVFLGDGRVEKEFRENNMESYKESSLGWKVNTHDVHQFEAGRPGFLPQWRGDNVFELQSSFDDNNWKTVYKYWLSVDEDGDLLCRKDSTTQGSREEGAPVLGEGNWNKWKYHIVEE